MQVPFHGRATRGWVLGAAEEVPPRMLPVRKVLSAVRAFDPPTLELLRWVSERYVAPLATVIARSHPPRVVSEEPGPEGPAPAPGRGTAPAPSFAAYRGGEALEAELRGGRGAFVLRPIPEDEVRVTVEAVGAVLAAGRRAIVLVPEVEPLPATARALVEAFGDVVGLHVGGDRRARYRRWLEIRAGRYRCVVGSRPTVFAPLEDVGLLWVARESHPGHREERAPYYHVRDVALARARLTGAVCVLSALCPSIEASVLDATEVAPARRAWPPVEVVRPGPEGRAPRLVGALREARRAFLYAPLAGYGVAQVCRACRSPAACAACGGLLRASGGEVRCAVCGAAGRCVACGAREFGIRRGGVERVEEWAAGLAPVPVRRGSGPPPGDGVTVGGPEAVIDVGPAGLDLVGILDADAAARRPGLGAAERSLATWMEAAAWARPRGRVVVQADRSNDPAVQALVAGHPSRFHRAEHERRREAGFPAGAPVFRIVGSAELPRHLEALEPASLLISAAEGETVCLLTLEAERVAAFGRLARELAARDVVTRVEAEPHL